MAETSQRRNAGGADAAQTPASAPAPTPALEVRGLSRRFGARRALRDVRFELPQGATLAVFGPNGAGKTTLLRILATLDRASAGEFRVLGADPKEDADAIRGRIGFISHQPMLYLDLTAEENLVLYGRLYGVADPRARAAELLERVELSHRANDVVRGFSRGMTQRMALARALVNDPELVFLDEPYSGLDPHAARIVDALFDDAGGSAAGAGAAVATGGASPDRGVPAGRTLVTVSHQLKKDFAHATHVLLLARGRQVLFAPTEGLDFGEFAALYEEQVGER